MAEHRTHIYYTRCIAYSILYIYGCKYKYERGRVGALYELLVALEEPYLFIYL